MTNGSYNWKMRIWRQDPSVKDLGIGEVYIESDVQEGPRDAQIAIRGLPPVAPSSVAAREYVYETTEKHAFDAVHTYTVARQVLSLYEAMLGAPLAWRWQSRDQDAPLAIYPRAGFGLNALYSRSRRALYFLGSPSRDVFTCRSLDVVAHETGHAVLDALQPYWWRESVHPQTAGLHEAFGDLTAIFCILSLPDLVQVVIEHTNADLDTRSFLTEFAEQLGAARRRGRENGLRNANNRLRLPDVFPSNSAYSLSQVFTGAVYDILEDVFAAKRDAYPQRDARCLSQALSEAGQMVAQLTLRAIQAAPRVNATFKDVAEHMLHLAEQDAAWETYRHNMAARFASRKILASRASTGFVAYTATPRWCRSFVRAS
jgi:hypothetical protein